MAWPAVENRRNPATAASCSWSTMTYLAGTTALSPLMHEHGRSKLSPVEFSAWRIHSALGPACVKTSFKSELGPNLLDFIKFQFAKALISLKLKFQWLGQVHNSSSSPTFLHSLGQKQKSLGSASYGKRQAAREIRSASSRSRAGHIKVIRPEKRKRSRDRHA
jgi:hypothetical protein